MQSVQVGNCHVYDSVQVQQKRRNPLEKWRSPGIVSSLPVSHRADRIFLKMGISRTTLVGRFERRDSDIFEITFSMRFCLSSKVLKGGLT